MHNAKLFLRGENILLHLRKLALFKHWTFALIYFFLLGITKVFFCGGGSDSVLSHSQRAHSEDEDRLIGSEVLREVISLRVNIFFFPLKNIFSVQFLFFRIDAAFPRTQKTQGVISNADALLPLSSVFTLPAKEKCVMEITFENLSTNTVFKWCEISDLLLSHLNAAARTSLTMQACFLKTRWQEGGNLLL